MLVTSKINRPFPVVTLTFPQAVVDVNVILSFFLLQQTMNFGNSTLINHQLVDVLIFFNSLK